MRTKRLVALTAAISAVGLAATACGNSSSSSSSSSSGSSAGYNAANTSIVNPQSGVGGTLKLEEAGSSIDTLDTGITYQAVTWDLYQLFDRTMMSYAPEPGAAGETLVNDLVSSWSSSNHNQTWTYHIQPNAKFSDGDPITTKDVAYAIERSNFDTTGSITGGPTYFANLIQNTNNYQGPYKQPNAQLSGILTPNATTITFNLTQPFADFNYLMTLPQTTPIEPNHDPGKAFSTTLSKLSFTGQYEVKSYTPNASLVLVPNPDFDESTDPSHLHVRHASQIDITMDVSDTTADQNLLSGSAALDIRGLGVQTATQNLILSNPKYRADSDDATTGAETFMNINTQVAPFNNVDCRQAIEWAVNKQQVQDVAGGAVGGGEIATTVLPTNNSGYKASDQYASGGEEGDAAKAKALVASCKTAEGSAFNSSFALATYLQSENPKLNAEANVIQQNLNAIGFNVSIDNFSYSSQAFWSQDAGVPAYADAHRVVLSLWAWTADFPTGFGYMDQILTKAGINTNNSYNLSYWNDPKFQNLLNEALAATSASQTDAYYAQADQYAMSQAVIVPLLYQTSLLYRNPTTTNVFVSQPYGMYDYGQLGTTAGN